MIFYCLGVNNLVFPDCKNARLIRILRLDKLSHVFMDANVAFWTESDRRTILFNMD